MEQPEIVFESPKPKKKFRLFRFLSKLLLFIVIFLFILLGLGAVIGYYYQDEVKEFVIKELNKQLNTEIIVEGHNIDFTVIKNFPYASVDFKNVKALDATEKKSKDTLFSAKLISLQFNLFDVFKKNYSIKKLELGDVNLNVKIDKNGKDNYHFWKSSVDSTSSQFKFDLEKIIFKKINVVYKNKEQNQFAEFSINKANLSGKFSEKNFSMNIESELFVNTIVADSTNFLRKKNVSINSILYVDNTVESYKFSNTRISIESMNFELFGTVLVAENAPILNVDVKGKDIDIQSLLSLIPSKYKGKINNYESAGDFYFDASIKGVISKTESPLISANFGITNADITQIKDNVTLKRVNLKGIYANENKKSKKTSFLSLSYFSAQISEGSISGNLNLLNLSSPKFDGRVKADLKLAELQKFLKADTIETIEGQLKVDVEFSGETKYLDSKKFESITTRGSLLINDMDLKLKNNALLFNGINGDFDFNNNDLKINHFYGNISNSDFELDGYMRNIIGFFTKENEDVIVEAKLISKKVNLNELIANKEDENNSKYKLQFSEHIDADLKIDVGQIEFRKFDATNIKGVVRLKNKKMILDPISLSTMGGSISTSGYIDASDTSMVLITCFSDVNKINISKMFDSFENFNQTTITNKNIKGVATAKIQFASVFTPELKMDYEKLYAAADLTIENGELNNVEAMKSLSRFIELSELENIKFATLKNQIEIKNQIINIPKVEVKSSALNVYLSGTHTFKNEINYKVKLSLNELLSKKAKKAKKENEDFGEIADDGLGRTNIFLSMTGTVDKPIIKYDSKSAIQNVKQDLKVEKQNLKSILKEEFGLFKKDSTLNKKKEEETKFTIKWEDADKKEEPKKEIKKPKKPEEEDF